MRVRASMAGRRRAANGAATGAAAPGARRTDRRMGGRSLDDKGHARVTARPVMSPRGLRLRAVGGGIRAHMHQKSAWWGSVWGLHSSCSRPRARKAPSGLRE